MTPEKEGQQENPSATSQRKNFYDHPIFVGVSALAIFIGTTLGLYVTVNGIVKENTLEIMKEVHSKAMDLADLYKDDLALRLRIVNREIEFIEKRTPIDDLLLERKKSQRDTLKHQLDEVNFKWFSK